MRRNVTTLYELGPLALLFQPGTGTGPQLLICSLQGIHAMVHLSMKVSNTTFDQSAGAGAGAGSNAGGVNTREEALGHFLDEWPSDLRQP